MIMQHDFLITTGQLKTSSTARDPNDRRAYSLLVGNHKPKSIFSIRTYNVHNVIKMRKKNTSGETYHAYIYTKNNTLNFKI